LQTVRAHEVAPAPAVVVLVWHLSHPVAPAFAAYEPSAHAVQLVAEGAAE